MKKFYTVEIVNMRFGNIRRVTVRAETKQKALSQVILGIGERIIAAWEL